MCVCSAVFLRLYDGVKSRTGARLVLSRFRFCVCSKVRLNMIDTKMGGN